jgi:hypothetical protein
MDKNDNRVLAFCHHVPGEERGKEKNREGEISRTKENGDKEYKQNFKDVSGPAAC